MPPSVLGRRAPSSLRGPTSLLTGLRGRISARNPNTNTNVLFVLFLLILLLRSRAITLPVTIIFWIKDYIASLGSLSSLSSIIPGLGLGGSKKKDKEVSSDELARVLQQVYVQEEDGSKTLLVPYRERIVRVPIRELDKGRFVDDRRWFPRVGSGASGGVEEQAVSSLQTQTLSQKPTDVKKKSKSKSKGLSLPFLTSLRALLHISIPSLRSRETLLIALHSSFLILRTVLSIMVAKLDGMIVRDLVRADGRGFLRGLGLWFVLALPSTFTNSMIRHLQSLLALRLRTNLTRYLHDLYLSSHPHLRYYRASSGASSSAPAAPGASSTDANPASSAGPGASSNATANTGAQTAVIEGIDQYLTADVEAWANALSGLYGNILKPSLDLLLFTSQLSLSLGLRGTTLLFLNYWITIRILRLATPSGTNPDAKRGSAEGIPSFATLAAREMQLEGEYRNAVGRVGREAEEVAFYDGGRRERDVLMGSIRNRAGGKEGVWEKLRRHLNRTYRIRIAYEWTEDYVIKYLWSAAGYALIAVPILYTRTRRVSSGSPLPALGARTASASASTSGVGTKFGPTTRAAAVGVVAGVASVVSGAAGGMGGGDEQIAGRTETYISSRRLLLNLADAGGRLMYAYKDLLELAGLTGRLYELVRVLVWVEGVRSGVGVEGMGVRSEVGVDIKEGEEIRFVDVDVRVPGSGGSSSTVQGAQNNDPAKFGAGISEHPTELKQNVDIDSNENANVNVNPPLVKSLTLSIKQTQHTMITGSNGVGKTAVARVLGGLWDVGGGGFISMPKDSSEVESFLTLPTIGASHSSNGPGLQPQPQPRARPRPTLYVLPQRSYMPVGSLLEQIIYPCSYAQFIKLTGSDEHRALPSRSKSFLSRSLERLPSLPSLPLPLPRTKSITLTLTQTLSSTPLPSPRALSEIHDILEAVHLDYLIGREGGLHVRKEWRDVLSGGEKQRMGMARVLWWRPKWAVLDECTSAVSSDVEGRMYEAAKGMGITLITISLRPSLAKYHTQLLTLHGPSPSESSSHLPGSWTLSVIGTPEERLSLTNEIRSLEEKLSEVEGWEERVKELEGMLSVQEGVGEEEDAEIVSVLDDESVGGSVVEVASGGDEV
ncbi:ABC transporter transmembrane region 2-domain-containing protein [Crepidotus variabilis]|uniref:ABC transporter transmembrane region 2-domain-containing protein n=1 Tax=Crepidotus variabilis TaxID=179855 RepID=A0A9P6EEI5_9AGAR|nr:ABC transporter transmembrane region 2-domain-containing protein [Crepidotus variabilis]